MIESVAKHLENLRQQYADRVFVAVQEFEAGGPDLEAKLNKEAQALPKEIVADCRVANAGAWSRVKAKMLEAKREAVREAVHFHESDLAKAKAKPPTIEEKDAALTRLAKLYAEDPLEYAKERVEWADKLCTTREALDKAVKIVRDRDDDKEQSQATKLVAIGVGDGVRLWHGPDRAGYASIAVDEHWENYRLESTAFDQWLRAEFGRQYTCKIGDQWLPQVPGSQAVRDAIAQLGGVARQREQFEPAIRVGGDREKIWIDLGDEDGVRSASLGTAGSVAIVRMWRLFAARQCCRCPSRKGAAISARSIGY
jgi:hypothetical protein